MATRSEHRAFNALRAVAAVLVVVYHLRLVLFVAPEQAPDSPITGVLYLLTNLGPGAVVLFFVLSGYWVGGSVFGAFRKDTFSWPVYAIARLSRLWVVLLPALALTALLDGVGQHAFGESSIYSGDPAYHGVVPENLDAHTTVLAALGTALFVNTNLVPTFGTDGSLWSLAYEASYYAILPLALCAWRYRRGLAGLVNALGLAAVCLIGGFDVLMYLPVWLLGALVAAQRDRIGAAVARLSPSVRRTARVGSALAMGAALCGTGVGYSMVAVGALAATTTAFIALTVEDVQWTGLPGRAINSVSRYAGASFSLYAIHLPLVVLLQAFLISEPELRWGPTPAHWVGLVGIVTVLTVVGWGFARLTEFHTERIRAVVTRRLIPVRSTVPTG